MTDLHDTDPAFEALRSLRADTPTLDDRTAGRIYAASLRRAHRAPRRDIARWRRPVLRAAVVTAAAALIAGAAVIALTPTRVDAAEILTRAAAAAAATADGPANGDRYLYVEMLRHNGLDTLHVQTWTSIDGTAPGLQVSTTDARAASTGSADAPATSDPGLPATSATTTLPVPDGTSLASSSPRQLASLPTDPQALLDRIETDPDVRSDITDNGVDPNVAVWEEIRELAELADSPTQAALFRSAALVPGLTVHPGVTDADGRTGTAVALTDARLGDIQLIFDDEGAFLGERILSARGDIQFVSARLVTDYVPTTDAP